MEKELIIKALNDALNIQLSDGNWNYNSYMHGMANGIIFALAVVEGSEPQYIDRPEEWLEDKRQREKEEKEREVLEGILKEAKERYRKGTVFMSAHSSEQFICYGNLGIWKDSVLDFSSPERQPGQGNGVVYDGKIQSWALIVKP